jgi:hypothetical protein
MNMISYFTHVDRLVDRIESKAKTNHQSERTTLQIEGSLSAFICQARQRRLEVNGFQVLKESCME